MKYDLAAMLKEIERDELVRRKSRDQKLSQEQIRTMLKDRKKSKKS